MEEFKENNRESFSGLSKAKILEKLKDNDISKKEELLKLIPKDIYWPSGVDENLIEGQKRVDTKILEQYGPKIGVIKIESRKTKETVGLSLHCRRRVFNSAVKYEINENGESIEIAGSDSKQGHYIYYYNLLDDKENSVASMTLEDYTIGTLSHSADIQKNLLNYSGNVNEIPIGFSYIYEMGGDKGYKGCGTSLHQIAVEHSIRAGFEGRVQLLAAGFGSSGETPVVTSAGFHENFGYIYKDVVDRGGNLHHKGEDIHKKLAESRWQEAEKYKKEHIGDPMPKTIKDGYRPTSDMGLYAYLPEEIVLREKERMLSDQHLLVNLDTLAAIENLKKNPYNSGI